MDKKARSYGPVEFSRDAWVRIFVSEEDLKDSAKFDEIIHSDKDLTEKSQLVEELIVELANDKLSEASVNAERTFGVKIDIESVGHEQIASHPINVPDLVEEETAEWKELQEYRETKKSSAKEKKPPYCSFCKRETVPNEQGNCSFCYQPLPQKEADYTNNNQDMSNWFNETKPPSESIDRLIDPPKTATDEEDIAVGDIVILDDFQRGPVMSLNEDGTIDVHVADAHQGPVIDTFDRGRVVDVIKKVDQTWLKKEEAIDHLEQDAPGWKAEPLDERYIEPMGSLNEEE